jgi:hypothetical protein
MGRSQRSKRALELLGAAKSGGEPTREQDEARRSPTMKSLGERVLKEHASIRCKPSTQAEYKRAVELFINPVLWRPQGGRGAA